MYFWSLISLRISWWAWEISSRSFIIRNSNKRRRKKFCRIFMILFSIIMVMMTLIWRKYSSNICQKLRLKILKECLLIPRNIWGWPLCRRQGVKGVLNRVKICRWSVAWKFLSKVRKSHQKLMIFSLIFPKLTTIISLLNLLKMTLKLLMISVIQL